MSARGRYARILRTPHVMPLLVAALVARLPIGIDSIAIVLFLRERTGSYAAAGIVSAAFALGGGAGAPLSGRLIDRFGHRRVLVPLALVHSGGLVLRVGPAFLAGRVALLLPGALGGGAAIPPISATMRPLWGPLLDHDAELLPAAYALDSIIIELVFTIGPLLTALATALLSPAGALGIAVVLVVGGRRGFPRPPPSPAGGPASPGPGPGPPRPPRLAGPPN